MHIYRQPNGRWRAIVQVDGIRRSATGTTRAEAQRRAGELLVRLGATTPTAPTTTVGELLDEHLRTAAMGAAARYDFELLRDKLPAWVKATNVVDVTPLVVERWYATLASDGWTAHRVTKLHTLLRSAHERARRWGWIPLNPVAQAQRPSVEQAEISPPSPELAGRLLAAADAHSAAVGAYVRLAATVGARPGELCGLQWPDLDLDASTLTVRRAVAYVPAQGLVVTPGKTGRAGHRVVAIGPSAVAALRAWRVELAGHALAAGMTMPAWAFTNDLLLPWRPDFISRVWRDDIRAAVPGADTVRLYDLRHYVATELLAAGVDVRTVAGRLGHRQSSTTLNVYAAFVPARDRAAAEILERGLGD